MAEARTVITSDYSLGKILSNLLSAIFQEQSSVEGSRFLQALLTLYNRFTYSEALPADVIRFSLDDQAASEAISTLKNHLQSLLPKGIAGLNSPITYLFDELICNIQQHAQTDAGYAQALNLAQSGYSVKNLPETENRGYGISSNMLPAHVPAGFDFYKYIS